MKGRDSLQSRSQTLHTVMPAELPSNCVIIMAEEDIGRPVVMDCSRIAGILTLNGEIANRERCNELFQTVPAQDACSIGVGIQL